MKWFTKQNARKVLNAIVITLAVAAVFHLTLVSIMALYKHTMSYLNPLDFLGVSILLPQYRDSTTTAGIGWLILTILFGTVLVIRAKYHVYLSVFSESRVGGRVVITTNKVRDFTKQLSRKPKK